MGLGMGGGGVAGLSTGRQRAWHSRGRETRQHPRAPGKEAGGLAVPKGEGGPLSGSGSALRRGQAEGSGHCV